MCLRARLYKLLDGIKDRTLIWLSAPAGAGKTTVVASWLQAHRTPTIWYQCDEGDADIASFFHFMSLGAQALLKTKKGLGAEQPLPQLSPELYPALSVFVRNYFRKLFARLTAPASIVLDNWQELPTHASLRELLYVALEEAPEGISFIVLSREDPPTSLSRLQSGGRMVVLRWPDLQLTEKETAGIVAAYEPMPGQTAVPPASALHAATHGWAAGLAVMLRHETLIESPSWSAHNASNQAVFDYLASEIFDRLELTRQEFLIKTACLESISIPVAEKLTNNDQAQAILDQLVQRNVFTAQRPASGSYQYHPLFREFLKSRAAAMYTTKEQRQHLQHAAQILLEHQDRETAIHLLLTAEAWSEAAQHITGIAPTLVQQGRFKTLAAWTGALPETLRATHAWLTYWLGVCQMATDFPAARASLEKAYELFLKRGDALGRMLVAADLIHYHEMIFDSYQLFRPWFEVLAELLDAQPEFPSPEIELRVLSGFLVAQWIGNPQHRSVNKVLARARELIGNKTTDSQSRALAIATLLYYYNWRGDTIVTRSLAPAIELLIADAEISPATRVYLYWQYAYYFFFDI